MKQDYVAHHLLCRPGDVGAYVLLPGDPGRAQLLASRLEEPRYIASNREFSTYTGMLDDEPVTVTSTGIGGPSTAIAVEELIDLGAHTFVRVGTAGGMQASVAPGHFVVAQAAVRDEGTSHQYVPDVFPAVASPTVVMALHDAARQFGVPHHVGIVHSKDSFYGQKRPETMPISAYLVQRWETWRQAGVLASEMEAAALFVVAGIRGRRAGAVLKIMSNRARPGPRPSSLDDLADLAIAGMRLVLQADRAEQVQGADLREIGSLRGLPPSRASRRAARARVQ
ncbi:MAG: nucleoside phosphorylase [Actinobacteria bacterium]|nr:nucleoside phosphorylase [Actinomycetota bacterium]